MSRVRVDGPHGGGRLFDPHGHRHTEAGHPVQDAAGNLGVVAWVGIGFSYSHCSGVYLTLTDTGMPRLAIRFRTLQAILASVC